MKPDRVQFEELVRRIVAAVHPLRIVLFGSAARGELGPESDVVVLVVVPEGTSRLRTAMDLQTRFAGLGMAVDVVVATPTDLEKYRDTVGFVYREALREGQELYAA